MGSGEDSTTAKPSRPTSTQEMPAMPLYPDWTSSIPAYYGAGATPPFFPSTVASPTPHPYLWGSQHLMPPYGTPVPYPALYPPGGVYAHPNMAMAPSPMPANEDSGTKAPEGKSKGSGKKPKRSSSDKAGDNTKTDSGSGNDAATQSAESGTDGSSDATDENNNNEFSASRKGSFDQMLADGAHAQSSAITPNFQTSVPGNPVVSVPASNLNIEMNLWSPPVGPGANKMQQNPAVMQDERELKRQKRKQSNRESARRSRLRKQAECEELQNRVEMLSNENHLLRDELQRLSEECSKLTSENDSIKLEVLATSFIQFPSSSPTSREEQTYHDSDQVPVLKQEEITKLYGPDAASKLENNGSMAELQANAD